MSDEVFVDPVGPPPDSPVVAGATLLEWLKWRHGVRVEREIRLNTPRRVARAFEEMTAGYAEDPKEILGKTFKTPEFPSQIVIVEGIRFVSLCAHHLLPFVGQATVGYVPGSEGRVAGLSKIPRLVECRARRLQLQETLAHEIAHDLLAHLEPAGVGVILKAAHSCMSCRGVKQVDAQMVTSVMLGVFMAEAAARAEFMMLANHD